MSKPKKKARPSGQKRKLRPRRSKDVTKEDKRIKHGLHSLERILDGELDKRYVPVMERDRIEAALVSYAGGEDAVRANVTLFIAIKKMAPLFVKTGHWEKMALLNEVCLGDKRYTAMLGKLIILNRQIEELISNNKKGRSHHSLEQYVEAK
jgi:hypothetical protein